MSSRATVVVDLTESDDCDDPGGRRTLPPSSEIVIDDQATLTPDLSAATGNLATEVRQSSSEVTKGLGIKSEISQVKDTRETRSDRTERSKSPTSSWIPKLSEERSSSMETSEGQSDSRSRSESEVTSQGCKGHHSGAAVSEPVCRRVSMTELLLWVYIKLILR